MLIYGKKLQGTKTILSEAGAMSDEERRAFEEERAKEWAADGDRRKWLPGWLVRERSPAARNLPAAC